MSTLINTFGETLNVSKHIFDHGVKVYSVLLKCSKRDT